MTDRELLQQALDALKHLCLHSAAIKGYDGEQVQTAIDALRARLEEPEQKWVGLTDEDMHELIRRFARYELIRAVEAKLKEKNGNKSICD